MKRNITRYRVIYGDCDSMAIVYYSNYLRFFEIGRTELLRDMGLTYREVEERGFFLPTTEAYLKYQKPALYDDLLTIETTIGFVRRASSRFNYTIFRGSEVLAQGYTVHACLDRDDRIVRFPDFLINLMKGDWTMNILFFGPNGSGKGTQGAILKERYCIPHIETGVIFRENISKGTELGKRAKAAIDRGELVPDEITIPMVLDRLKGSDCADGWLLDGFPRNITQAIQLNEALAGDGINVHVLVEVMLDREIAKKRIMGRRLCVNDNNHPNNVNIDAIKPDGGRCRICGGELRKRDDDQDEEAIDQRHDIYYDAEQGTLAAVQYFKGLSAKTGKPAIVEVDGRGSVEEVTTELIGKLGRLREK